MQHITASLEFLRVLLYFGENLELIIICFYVFFFRRVKKEPPVYMGSVEIQVLRYILTAQL